MEIHHVAVPGPGGLLVLLCEDGGVQLLDGESLERHALPLKCAPDLPPHVAPDVGQLSCVLVCCKQARTTLVFCL